MEKGRVTKCGCPDGPFRHHEHQDGNVQRVKIDGVEHVFINLLEGMETVGICEPATGEHVHSSDCYANTSRCMQQPFGTSTRIGV